MTNLVPQKNKKEIYKIYKLRATAVFLGVFFVLVTILLGATLPSYLVFYNKNKALESSIETLNSGYEDGDVKTDLDEVRKVDNQLDILKNAGKEDVKISDMLEYFLEYKTSNISIKSIISNDRENFELRGSAINREDLLLFIQNLEDDPRIKNVESPISNLLADKDAEFLITLQIGHE